MVADASRDAYPTLDDFLEDVAAIIRDEIRELARLGARYIQLDAPHYPLLIDDATRAFYESQGWSADRWLDRGIELDNWVISGHPGVTFGFHLCRGNQGAAGSRRAGTSPSRGACSAASEPTGCCSSTTTSGRGRSSRSTRCPTTGWSCSAW